MLKASVTNGCDRLLVRLVSSILVKRGVATASEGRGESVAEIYRAYEEVIDVKKEQQCLRFSQTLGHTTSKMPGKKVCIVGSGNWYVFIL